MKEAGAELCQAQDQLGTPAEAANWEAIKKSSKLCTLAKRGGGGGIWILKSASIELEVVRILNILVGYTGLG